MKKCRVPDAARSANSAFAWIRLRSASAKRHDVILPVAWASAACFPGGGTRMLALKLPCHLSGSILSGCEGAGKRQRNRHLPLQV
jgi:hypothetical protein